MRVVVTGALGHLGSVVTPFLLERGVDVVATDLRAGEAGGRSVRQLDVRDAHGWTDLLAGADAVVHCAAIRCGGSASPDVMLATNVGGTANLCRAAVRSGVRSFVFSSSIQVVASEGVGDDAPSGLPYLPLDGACPPNPTNLYASTKAAGESLVRALLVPEGIECQSLRFPWLVEPDPSGPWGRTLTSVDGGARRIVADQGFSCLSFRDASRLIFACLGSSLPGHRSYLPALSGVPAEWVPRCVEAYFPDVPLTRPVEEIDSLVDLSAIRDDTGWTPLDVPPRGNAAGAGSWVRRMLARFG